ncbi:hypothetical protein SteCoe_7523 [Stentor coeruleus]|uniref:Major facilitator superfamily (MFS) profile domain-containing protein n=1 Tax=Stentor coeruleus TaxID=5963 RepID=A0A1R2CM86_9CILI|nr:hypothetical protein SteCoe_7523 [Stentor coeruleus]
MGEFAKELSIYSYLIMAFISNTCIFTFFPKIAESKDFPLSQVGIVFSINPLCNIICSCILSKTIHKIGRKTVIQLSITFSGLSMLVFSPILLTDIYGFAIFSILNRIFVGISMSCGLVAAISVFTSDYPEKIPEMIGKMEVAISVGLILGSLCGPFMEKIGIGISFIVFGCLFLLALPITSYFLQTFRPYEMHNTSLIPLSLALKPKIFFTLIMDFIFLFQFGLLGTILEIHLGNFGFSNIEVGFVFSLETISYLICALVFAKIFKINEERYPMIVGLWILGFGYLLLGSAGYLISFKEISIIGLPFIGIGECLIYLFSVPYIINAAHSSYKYPKNDELNDKISVFVQVASSIGEILGPIYAGFISDLYSIQTACVCFIIFCFLFSLIYCLFTQMIPELFCKTNLKNTFKDQLIPKP